MHNLIILPAAEQYLKKIREKQLKTAFQDTIDRIREDPYIGDPKSGDLSGTYCCDVYYNKTNYELAYTIVKRDGETIVVILAGTRENFYDQLKRYMKIKL